jgi:hypothetical protein
MTENLLLPATPVLDRFRDIVNKTRQANSVVRFDDAVWIVSHLYDIDREVQSLQMLTMPWEQAMEMSRTILSNMDVMLDKASNVAALRARIKELEQTKGNGPQDREH